MKLIAVGVHGAIYRFTRFYDLMTEHFENFNATGRQRKVRERAKTYESENVIEG